MSQRAESIIDLCRRYWSRDGVLALILFVAIIFAYQQVWHAGFIWDDDQHLTQNPCVVGPLGLKEIWTTKAARICPLVLSTFWVEHKLWGLNPLPYHLLNVFLHGASAVVFWRALRTLQVPGSWLGAALWALHPVQVESVAWITELKNTQSALFYLSSVLFFVKWKAAEIKTEQLKAIWYYPLGLFFGVLAMASKSSTVVLPLVLGLCAWWMDGRWQWRNTLRLAPFFLMTLLAGALSIWTQKLEGALDSPFPISGTERIAVVGHVIWFYLGKLAWPHPLIFIYPRWHIDTARITAYLPTFLALLLMGGLWWKRRGGARPVYFAYGYFVIALLPVLGLLDHYFLRYSFVGDHFQYLASMGPLALAGAGIATGFDWVPRRKPFLQSTFVAVLLLGLGLLTWRQCAMYSNDETLYRVTIDRNPGAWMSYYNLGYLLFQQGRTDEAIVRFRETLQIRPNYVEAHTYIGEILVQQGHPDEAIAQFREALRIDPAFAMAHNNLGIVLFQKGQIEEAISQFREALQINPTNAQAHYNLALALFQQGRAEEAIAHAQKVLELQPGNVVIQNTLAWMLATAEPASLRNGASAIQLATQASQSTGGNPLILRTLAAAYAETGRFSEAVEIAQRALQLAETQSNAALAEALRNELSLYRSNQPFHIPETMSSSSPTR
jgi:tetratricopeptide (TPR) repeat protein